MVIYLHNYAYYVHQIGGKRGSKWGSTEALRRGYRAGAFFDSRAPIPRFSTS
jgi:hypothetical protein